MALTTVCTGFEFGATSGWATGSAGKKIFDVITGSPTISTTSPATGNADRLGRAPSAATCAVQWDTNTFGGSQTFARRVFKILLESLPSADTILAQVDSGVGCLFQFKQSSGKFAMNFEGDALTDGGPVISTGVWYTIEQYVSVGGGTRTCDWWIDGAPMTQVTHVSAAGSINALVLGCNFTSQTFTARYDDVVAWVDTSAIGDKGKHKVIFLGIDTAATVTLGVGASSNWNTFAGATPTLTAWNAATARDNVDERPVNTTSAQDGIALVANAPTNTWYVEIPMTTYSLVSGETVTMARMLCCGWQASGSSANCGIRSFNGTTETVLLATSTAFTALGNNTASPGWICGMLTPADIDTQSELDALAIRWGFSTDGNPDIGFHAIYVELAVKVKLRGHHRRHRHHRRRGCPRRHRRPGRHGNPGRCGCPHRPRGAARHGHADRCRCPGGHGHPARYGYAHRCWCGGRTEHPAGALVTHRRRCPDRPRHPRRHSHPRRRRRCSAPLQQ